MLGCISSTHQFFFSRPYFLSIKQWPFIKLYMKLCFHLPLEGTYFGGSCPLVTSLSRNPSPASLTYMNTFPERICQLFFLLLSYQTSPEKLIFRLWAWEPLSHFIGFADSLAAKRALTIPRGSPCLCWQSLCFSGHSISPLSCGNSQ